jgi:hypothetical protein
MTNEEVSTHLKEILRQKQAARAHLENACKHMRSNGIEPGPQGEALERVGLEIEALSIVLARTLKGDE